MRGSAALRTGVAPGGALAGPWVQNSLWTRARAVPSLDLRFADNKSLVDATTGSNLVTHTRASSGTFVGSDGVLRTAVTNLLLRSEEFGTTWTAPGLSAVTPNTTVAPNGTTTADTLVETTGVSEVHRVGQTISVVSGTTYTLSVFAKQGSRQYIYLGFGPNATWNSTGAIGFFDLQNGTINTLVNCTATIVAYPNGWYRCTVTSTPTATNASALANIGVSSNGSTQTYTGDGSNAVILWGAQLEQSATVGEYIPTTSTINSAPRFDHDPTTGESLGLLVEEQRTNLLLRSEEFDDASWNSAAGARTITPNSVAAPDGLLTADTFAADGTTNAHFVSQSLTLSAVPYAYSVFAKAGTNNFLQLRTFNAFGGMWANFDLATGVVGTVGFVSGAAPTSSIQAYPNGWYRCKMLFTPTATTSSVAANIVNSASAGGSSANSLSTTLYLWGAQLEAGAFPTSYIPTTDATATRAADVASITGSNFSSWYRQDEGTVFAEFVPRTFAQSCGLLSLDNGTTSERLQTRLSTNGKGAFVVVDGGSVQANFGTVASTSLNTKGRLATSFAVNSFKVSLNGGSVASDTSGTLPTVAQAVIGNAVGVSIFNGPISRIAFWPRELPESTLQTITQ
jgi:hypothetical protein